MATLRSRGLLPRVKAALGTAPVVILEGARAVGKTSLGHMLVDDGSLQTVVDLSEPANLTAARASPSTFIDRLPVPCMIDEAQLVPELTVAVKRRVDRKRGPGLFILTGSSRLGRAALGGSDPLAGRALRMRLRSMTQGEIDGAPTNVVDALFDGSSKGGAAVGHDELMMRIRRGGLPLIALGKRDELVRAQYLTEYVEAVIEHETERRRDRAELIRTARYFAASTARILNVATAAGELGTTRETLSARLATLESLFLLELLPGQRPNEHKVLTAHPKVHASDTALAAWAARATADAPAHVYGALVETFVVNELMAQSGWSSRRIEIRHFRDTARKLEVDAVALRDDGASIAIEVKAGVDVRPDDLAGLRAYLAAFPTARRGVVFYGGARVLALDDRIDAVPIGALWHRGKAQRR